MKKTLGLLLLISTLSIAGCGTLGTLFVSDPTVSEDTKRVYLEKLDRLKENTARFRAYHYVALAFIAGGLCAMFLKKGDTATGVASVLSGFVISGWAMYAPNHEKFVGTFLVILIIIAVTYLIYKVYEARMEGLQTTKEKI